MEPYELDAGTITWATKRNKALRRALTEIPVALIGLKKAISALKTASKGFSDYPESDAMDFYIGEIQGVAQTIEDSSKRWMDDADALQLGIINYQRKDGG